jgi:predicted ester cyclase
VSHVLIRQYFASFNERRLTDAAELFTEDAMLEHPPFGQALKGPAGYLTFAGLWVGAFPDAAMSIERVEQRGDTICEVDVVSAGTHQADLDLGAYGVIKASGARASLRFRQMLEIRYGRITFSSISFDMQDLLRQLQGAADTPDPFFSDGKAQRT